MNRKRYVLKSNEIDVIINGLIESGPNETYNKMKNKAILSMEKIKDLDEMFMDMSEDFLNRAREEPKDEGEKKLQEIYYTLNTMLRKLAHEVHLFYKKAKDKKRTSSNRFLKLIVNNKDAPFNFITKE